MTHKSFCSLAVVLYEDINCAACWKVNMQSHILKKIYCATTAVLSASLFFSLNLPCLVYHPIAAMLFMLWCHLYIHFWSSIIINTCAQCYSVIVKLSLAVMIIWLSWATVTVKPPKHSNQERLVLSLSLLLCFCRMKRLSLVCLQLSLLVVTHRKKMW